ncbi:MAG TPA: hypothetical protein VFD23_03800, partial [Clostridia bacterium]|nr:hypothetical protein [Clostridia bacterium]
MMGNYQVRFLGDKGGAIRLRYPTKTTQRTICYIKTEKEKQIRRPTKQKFGSPTLKPTRRC